MRGKRRRSGCTARGRREKAGRTAKWATGAGRRSGEGNYSDRDSQLKSCGYYEPATRSEQRVHDAPNGHRRQYDQHLVAFRSGWAIESTPRIIDSRAVVVPERACRRQYDVSYGW
jgi:hypothetical protein